MKTIPYYRIQDKEGRGPFKPGMTQHWADTVRNQKKDQKHRIPIFDEQGIEYVDKSMFKRGQYGTVCYSIDHLKMWFSAEERRKMHDLGYYIVEVTGYEIIFKGKCQLLISSPVPLSEIPMHQELINI